MENIKKITSFTVDHRFISAGIYVSRIDGDVTTYDMRTRRPNCGDYMDSVTMHTLEHMFATYIRFSEFGENIIYFGPMGCRTGFYLLVRNMSNEETLELVKQTLKQVIEHEGEVFGSTRKECGNYQCLDLKSAKDECKRYLDILNSKEIDFKYREG